VHDYYKKSSCIDKLKNIKTKTLLIQALDDPFLTPTVLPTENELSATTQLEVLEKGGHVGFISKAGKGQLNYWLDSRIPFFIESQT